MEMADFALMVLRCLGVLRDSSGNHFGDILKLMQERPDRQEVSAGRCSLGLYAFLMLAREILVGCGKPSAVSWHPCNSNKEAHGSEGSDDTGISIGPLCCHEVSVSAKLPHSVP